MPKPVNIVVGFTHFNEWIANTTNGHHRIPWPAEQYDADFFKKLTTSTINPLKQNAVIMGYNTARLHVMPLYGRFNVVITSREESCNVHAKYPSLERALDVLDHMPNIESIYVVGGIQLYQYALSIGVVEYIYATVFKREFDGNVKFPWCSLDCFSEARILFESENKVVRLYQRVSTIPRKKVKLVNTEEVQYLNLVNQVIETGIFRECGNSKYNSLSLFGQRLEFNLSDNTLPLLTTKYMSFNDLKCELHWFLSGSCDVNDLVKQGVHTWDKCTSRKWLDANGFKTQDERDAGPIYGSQWRRWGERGDVDQMTNLISSLRESPFTGNHIVTAWNPSEVSQTVRTPVNLMFEMYVSGDYLDCQVYMHDADLAHDVPSSMAMYALLTHAIAQHISKKARRLVIVLGRVYVYSENVDSLKFQLERDPFAFPKVQVKMDSKFNFTECSLHDYFAHDKIAMKVIF